MSGGYMKPPDRITLIHNTHIMALMLMECYSVPIVPPLQSSFHCIPRMPVYRMGMKWNRLSFA